ncbi:MAG: hypothetical protein HPY79_02815 [Bacteroidales bacterium]|nr:hypothetical protein [Bacteroidales bacterium]
MKCAFKCSLITGAWLLFFSINSLYSQENSRFNNLQIFFYTNDDNSLLLVNNDGTKNLTFQVKGLKDNNEASLFISTLKLYKGIIDIQISDPLPNQLRQVTAKCHPGYTLNNVNVVLGEALKIKEVFVDNQKIETNKLEQTYK